ncbi:hypothetical protein P3X46_026860 [Hevea brasiliensis]|uniref:Uncharacterized protein n=1 Tax=Hevea brasiliensis TaxID=3981 RepID=A0ABQ9KZP0_HEVBR|nr:uncharacterized protein LOC110656734 [Hevea brasiliensis]KAJ9153418.1 hypothetical protein P3X46_026860 [Hevea brasiliensis]
MKTVTGKIVSSTPVPIYKAASIISNFASSETGASQAVSAYLRRATAAFDELARLHPKPDRKKHKKRRKHRWDATVTVTNEIPAVSEGPSHR